jgi:hypothetical protein
LIIIAIIFGVVLLLAFIGLLTLTRTRTPQNTKPTAIITLIQFPTGTIQPPTTSPTPFDEPVPTSVPPSPQGTITLGGYVEVSGTGGDGLRLRSEAGINSDVRILAAEKEVFQVQDGPAEIDGYTWWYLVGLTDSSQRGWAVSNYLVEIPAP